MTPTSLATGDWAHPLARSHEHCERDDRLVEYVKRDNAVDFVEPLSARYRPPSEAAWEDAASPGTSSHEWPPWAAMGATTLETGTGVADVSIGVSGAWHELGSAPHGVLFARVSSGRRGSLAAALNQDLPVPAHRRVQNEPPSLGPGVARRVRARQDAAAPLSEQASRASGADEPAVGEHPYAALVRALLHRDETEAARALLAAALTVVGPTRTLLDLSRVLAKPQAARVRRNDRDRAREYRWIREHADAYRGQWVAVLGDRLVACAPSFRDLRLKMASGAFPEPPLVERID